MARDTEIGAERRGCTGCGLDPLSGLAEVDPDRNLVLSSLGLCGVLAMTWAGAWGPRQRMRQPPHLPQVQDRLHPRLGAFQYDLDQR